MKEKLEIIVARIDERLTATNSVIDEIKSNHLPHISMDIKELRVGQEKTNLKIAYWSGTVVAAVAIVEVILKIFFK